MLLVSPIIFPHCSLVECRSISSVLNFYPGIPKNFEDDFSFTHSSCWKRRKPLDTAYLPFIWGSCLIQFNWKCSGHLQATREFEYSHSFFPHWRRAYLRSTSIIERILTSSRFSLALPLIHWETYHHLVWWLECSKYLDYEKMSNRIWKKCILSTSHLQEWSRRRKSKCFNNPLGA